MKSAFSILITTVCLLGVATVSSAGDLVDLRGKKGVVDPKDLKKDNPKPPKLQKVVPPPPGSESKDKKEAKKPSGQGGYAIAK